MLENNCKTIVFSSSATVYGNPKDELLKESADINPLIHMDQQNLLSKTY